MENPMPYQLRALARLLNYPGAELRAQLEPLQGALQLPSFSAQTQAGLRSLLDYLGHSDSLQIEQDYVATFDRGRATALHLFEHVHGDSRERGPAMLDLAATYAQKNVFLAPGELPDHLCVALEFASVCEAQEARDFLAETGHILQAIYAALVKRASPWAGALAAVLELAGVAPDARAGAAPDNAESLDQSWQEPPAFGGCDSAGQLRADGSMPLNFYPPTRNRHGARP
ncbi:nitrate reductase molybdenum cofactor assembly chaperone [Massilia sp. W12]|uniref:nitrate reductase molybdenum cofactor assembly chaperone n=1 Tax=Massilia sp. W12 TaxID=3126507 RepID=UPI0030CC5465